MAAGFPNRWVLVWQTGRRKHPIMLHAVKRSLTPVAFYGIWILLQILCLTIPVLESAGQICLAFLNSANSAYAEFKLALTQQEEYVLLKGLQSLLFIHLIMLLNYCASTCMVMTMCIAKPVLFLLKFNTRGYLRGHQGHLDNSNEYN